MSKYFDSIRVGRVNKDVRGFINIKIDRTTVLGNPFIVRKEVLRDYVCEQHAKDFDIKVRMKDHEVRKEIIRIFKIVKNGGKVNLQCWCAPKRCHGNHIREFLLEQLEKV